MSIKPVLGYTLVCDVCGVDALWDHDVVSYADVETVRMALAESGAQWLHVSRVWPLARRPLTGDGVDAGVEPIDLCEAHWTWSTEGDDGVVAATGTAYEAVCVTCRLPPAEEVLWLGSCPGCWHTGKRTLTD